MKFLKKSSKLVRNILLHLIGWLAFFTYPALLLDIPFTYIPFEIRIIDIVVTIGFFYLNAFYIVPKLLLKRKYIAFAIFITLSVFLFSKFASFSKEYIKNETPKVVFQYHERSGPGGYQRSYKIEQHSGGDIEQQRRQWVRKNHHRTMSMGFFFTLAISTSFGLMLFYIKEDRNRKSTQNERLNSELSFLKSQVNPHFLFNVLNNMYSLSLKQSDNLPTVILKLSEMMRYMLYDSEEQKVRLDQEIDYIRNYIELQKLRVYDNCTIDFRVEGVTFDKKIAPMLLIPFVENAFKHGISHAEASPIEFLLEIKGQNLYFRTKNALFSNKAKDKTGGIGIQNVKRRLELIYPKNYSLTINEQKGVYFIELEIRLNHDELLNS